ncbi:hypothetical protein DL96DRAFT_996833 [Flagelloscypha sp. PMI_526]|nr:hypothetical protein DL96DRAFT_996833 [Flagelloscypha sp. PMI_526]
MAALPEGRFSRPRPKSINAHDLSTSHDNRHQFLRSNRPNVPSPRPNVAFEPSITPRPGHRSRQQPALGPSAIPPIYPEGTTWVVKDGKPQQITPEQYLVWYGTQSHPVHTSGIARQQRMTDVGNWAIKTESQRNNFQSAFDNPLASTSQSDSRHRSGSRPPVVPPPGFPGPVMDWRDIPREKINFPIATVETSSENLRRSRSHSRSRSEHVAPTLGQDTPWVPLNPRRPGRQNKPAPIPAVIPPGYPVGTQWVVDSNGRPRLETPEQYLARYGTPSPAVPLTGHDNPHQISTPQTSTSSNPSPRKPLLKRVFGGIIGTKKPATIVAPAPAAPAKPDPQPSSTSRVRSRAKSM